jgi:hypothetical protein
VLRKNYDRKSSSQKEGKKSLVVILKGLGAKTNIGGKYPVLK